MDGLNLGHVFGALLVGIAAGILVVFLDNWVVVPVEKMVLANVGSVQAA